ncbi:hypothetical protein M900_0802 [Bacteriovorax sp. Seq25_V]|nr:hypothetical protein M900_0802 [Bacteriovorax sp. Seq25_V]
MNYRDSGQHSLVYRSEVMEGDEIQTSADSYLWIFLYDGTLVRLAPKSSITFKEINILADKIFWHARVNLGNVLWLNRSTSVLKEQTLRQTDQIFFPLSLYDANPLVRDTSMTLEEYLFSDNILTEQPYQQANWLIEKNNKWINKVSEVFLVLPNASIHGLELSIDTYVGLGQANYFKVRDEIELGLLSPKVREFKYNLRGFANEEISEGSSGFWYEVPASAREANQISTPPEFSLNELITKRIPSIYHAREIMLDNYSRFIFKDLSVDELAKDYGIRKWNQDELSKRVDFLWTFMRRLETSNLVVASRYRESLLEKYNLKDDNVIRSEYYTLAYDRYMKDGEAGRENIYVPKLNSEKKKRWQIMHGIRTRKQTKEDIRKAYYEEVKLDSGISQP